jgi:hypothetical protein
MIRAALIAGVISLAVTVALAQPADSTQPATHEAATAAAPAHETPPRKSSAADSATKAGRAATRESPPMPVLSTYVPQTPPGEPKVADAIPGKDGIKRLLVLRGLDKITGRPTNIYAPVGVPVKFATLVITARYCYSTPPSEPPETTAFLQITDNRPDKSARQVFSGWMLASSPSLNALQHPLYDVWVISCMTNQPGQQAPVVASTAAVKTVSPDAGSKEAMPQLPEGSGQ